MRPLALRELLSLEVNVLPIVDLGGGRRYVPFAGGSFTGGGSDVAAGGGGGGLEGLSGRLLEGGVDWQLVRPDGTIEIDAHYALLTERDEAIEVRSVGLRQAAPAVAERLARGEDVDPDEYYFRTHVRFTTAAPRLARLNDLLAVSTGERHRAVVNLSVHEVL